MVGEENRQLGAPSSAGRAHIGVIAPIPGGPRSVAGCSIRRLEQPVVLRPDRLVTLAGRFSQPDMRQRRAGFNQDSVPYQLTKLEMRTQRLDVGGWQSLQRPVG